MLHLLLLTLKNLSFFSLLSLVLDLLNYARQI